MSAASSSKFILGDPGAVGGGGKKSKRARKKFGRRKVKNDEKRSWGQVLKHGAIL